MAMKRPGIYVGLSAYYFDDTAIMDAGEDAELLYVRMLAYASRQMEYEGFISDQVILSRLGILPRESGNGTGTVPGTVPGTDAASRAGRLAGVGLLTREDGGYRITGWLKWNKSAAEMGKERARDRERKQGADKGLTTHGAGSQPGTDTGTGAGNGAGVGKQRPDQTRPDQIQTSLSPVADAPSKSDRTDDDFAEWYAAYPRKTARGRALTAYRTARKKTDAATLLVAINQQAAQLMAKGAEFAPYPATWLNGGRWLDEAPVSTAAPGPADDDWEEPEEDRAMYEAYDAQMRALEEANR